MTASKKLGDDATMQEVYAETEKSAQAISLCEQTLADCERVLGDDHLDTLSSRKNLADASLCSVWAVETRGQTSGSAKPFLSLAERRLFSGPAHCRDRFFVPRVT